ncbi:MAG: SusD/RagB family nutrient-binding outer membrane lipoprotein [Chitinophagaceae bacterium]|nr:SusD/RagB family nutrient-binding outer membrane lipoprotein [Chitinophagaceae bacterium]
MKKIFHLYIIGATLLVIAGCNTKELQDLNNNPQAQPTINLNFLFTNAQLSAASGGIEDHARQFNWKTNVGLCSYAIQHLAYLAGPGIGPGDKYTEDFEASFVPFEYMYSGTLKNVNEILYQVDSGFAKGEDYNNLKQASRVLKAFTFHRLTDYYGSIPYFDALKNKEGVFFPSYDKQKDIYMDLLKELDEATAAFTAAAPDGFAEGDLFYNGDIDKWKRWGYSLMLRLAMRISNVDAATANTYVAKAVAGGVFTGNDDNVYVPMAIGPIRENNQNGLSRSFIPGDGGQTTIMSKTLIDFLKGANPSSTTDDDPRLMILCGGIGTWNSENAWNPINTNPVNQKGMPNGKDETMLRAIEGIPANADFNPNLIYSKINPKLLDRDEPYQIMNYGEVELLLAEAAERSIGGLSPADAKAHYEKGVKAAMQMLVKYDPSFAITDGQVSTYLTTYPYGVTKPALEMIGDQLWVCQFLNWWEAWSNYRRTGFPALIPINYPGNVTGGVIPTRLNYPTGEISGNPNYAAGATKPNTWTTKVWWAGGPE